MPQDLLSVAREQAEQSAPAIKAAALLHIARVLTTIDRVEAASVLDRGLAVAATLPADDRDILLREGAALAATVSPQQGLQLAREASDNRELWDVLPQTLFSMIEHGYIADAVSYLSDPRPADIYPFDAALQAMGRCRDEETRLRLFRGAIRAMRQQQAAGGRGEFGQWHHFLRLFTYHWTRLPADEARAVVREIVEWILAEPDSRTNASFASGSHRVHFSSTHEQFLFEVLGPLRHLDPDLAASSAKDYPQLSAAAERFPFGMESMNAAMRTESPPTPREAIEQPHYIDVGHRLIPIQDAIRTEFKDAFAVALDLYAADSDPENFNDVPRECWPSASEFRKILYKAGQHEGVGAARYLDRIPDAALRLFAQIELAAALAGLPQLGGRSMRRGPRHPRDRMAFTATPAPPSSARARRVVPPPRRPNLPPSVELRVSPATLPADEGPSGGSGPDFVEIRNAALKAVVSKVFEMPETRIDWPSSLDGDARYDFVLVLPHPEHHDKMMRLVQEGIANYFGVRAAIDVRPTDVYVVTAPNGIKARTAREESFGFGSMGIDIGAAPQQNGMDKTPPPIPAAFRLMEIMDMPAPSWEMAQPRDAIAAMRRRIMRQLSAPLGSDGWIGGIDAALTIEELCETIEAGLDRPVIDETTLTGTYAINVHTTAAATIDFVHILCERLGLVLTTGRRDVRTLVIRADSASER